MNKNQKGFSLIVIIIITAVIAVAAGAGYYVYQKRSNQNNESSHPPYFDCPEGATVCPAKPIIYLYPTKIQETSVVLNFNGQLTSTYPDFDKALNGWDVIAKPDGTLINKADNKEYSYIFWEGKQNNNNYDLSSGYVVKGTDTKGFLQKTLAKIGLTPKEYNEMIVYWLPQMEHNKYNLIHFAGKEYTDKAKLTITPTPDSILRVFMVYKSLDKYQDIKPQDIKPFERKGFTVVEWGGAKL